MSNLAIVENTQVPAQRRSVTVDMAERYGMDHVAFETTLRATVVPRDTTREEFAAFLLVAREYKLNPITKEIYAFPKKGGGIVPVVSIDGWMNLINSHPAFDGMEFETEHDDKGDLVSVTCTIYRKDRKRPTKVTEYFSECSRATDPWKMKHRMLRHKAAIQCARYAFGFAGIFEEDEAERIIENAGNAARNRAEPPAPPLPPPTMIEAKVLPADPMPRAAPVVIDVPATPPMPPAPPAQPASPPVAVAHAEPDPEAIIREFQEAADAARDAASLFEAWDDIVTPHQEALFPPDLAALESIRKKRTSSLEREAQ